jgi:amino acid transporter
MLYGLQIVALPYAVFIIAAWALYPGASMEWAAILTLVGAIPLGTTYALFSSIYPRSGGDYVFLSRTLHPAVAFCESFMFTFWQTVYIGLNAAFMSLFGLSPLLAILGLQLDNATVTRMGTFFSEPLGIFIAGMCAIVITGYVLYLGSKFFFKVQKWISFIGLGSLGISMAVMALTSAKLWSFQESFDNLAGSGAYQKVIATAADAGTNLNPDLQFLPTWQYMIWPAFSLLFPVLAVSFSGEVKDVNRGQLYGINGAMILGAILMALLMYTFRHAVGSEFLIAASTISPEEWPLPIPPYFNLLGPVAAGSPALTIIMTLWVLLFEGWLVGAQVVYSSRVTFAWGIDGLAPRWLTRISPKHASPGNAILACIVVGVIFLALYAFTSLIATVAAMLGLILAFLLTSVTASVFPYIKKEVFETSPAAMRFLGVPVMTIAGLISTAICSYLAYRCIVDDLFGANYTPSLILTGAVVLAGFIWYGVAVWYRSHRGDDLAQRFEEIPIE